MYNQLLILILDSDMEWIETSFHGQSEGKKRKRAGSASSTDAAPKRLCSEIIPADSILLSMKQPSESAADEESQRRILIEDSSCHSL